MADTVLDQLETMLMELERLATAATGHMQRIADEVRETGDSKDWGINARLRPDYPLTLMWNHAMQTRQFAQERGFNKVADCIKPGIVKDSGLARSIQRTWEELQQQVKENFAAKRPPNEGLEGAFADQVETTRDVCMQKIVEARQAQRALRACYSGSDTNRVDGGAA